MSPWSKATLPSRIGEAKEGIPGSKNHGTCRSTSSGPGRSSDRPAVVRGRNVKREHRGLRRRLDHGPTARRRPAHRRQDRRADLRDGVRRMKPHRRPRFARLRAPPHPGSGAALAAGAACVRRPAWIRHAIWRIIASDAAIRSCGWRVGRAAAAPCFPCRNRPALRRTRPDRTARRTSRASPGALHAPDRGPPPENP